MLIICPDLKLDNILVTFEDQSVIESFVEGQLQNPMSRKVLADRVAYLCHNDFGEFDGKPALRKMSPKIADFSLAERGDQPGPLIHPIQPDHCHAPEVLFGTGWSYGADIWNFGSMVRITIVLGFPELFTSSFALMPLPTISLDSANHLHIVRCGTFLTASNYSRQSIPQTILTALFTIWQT